MGQARRASELVRNHIPKFNPVIARGIVYNQFKELEEYINKVFREIANSFPPQFKYNGCRRCTPDEETRFLLEKKSSQRPVDLADSSIYLMMLEFEFEGQLIHHELYLPYVTKGGNIMIRGVKMTLIPILTSPVFSVEAKKQQIFMKFLTLKPTFRRRRTNVLQNGKEVPLSVTWAKIHHVKPEEMTHYASKKDDSVKIMHATPLYLFCEYGVTKSFERYCGFKPLITIGPPEFSSEEEREKYTVYSSRGKKPTTVKHRNWEPHDIHISVPVEYIQSNITLGLIGGFFYVADSYSQYMHDLEELEEPSFWQVILGKAIFLTTDGVQVLLKEIRKHMLSVHRMLDFQMKEKLNKQGIHCENTIDLFAYIIDNFTEILHTNDQGSIYHKELLVLRNVLEEFIIGMNNIQFKTQGEKPINLKTIRNDIARQLACDKILTLSRKTNYCVSTACPSDNMMFAHTCKFVMQNNLSNTRKESKINIKNPDNYLHPSVLEIGSYLAVKKGECTGRQLLNPYQVTTSNGVTKPNPKLKKKLDWINEAIRRY